MNWSLTPLTWWCLGIIFAVCIASFIYIYRKRNKNTLSSVHRSAEYLPTLVSTLGVLGTFLGITIGLLAFDTKNLDLSIPQLLDGLKTAFFTSLAGMIGSVFLSWYLNRSQDKHDGGISDINQAAISICQSVGQLASQMKDEEKDRKAFYRIMSNVIDNIKVSQDLIATTLGNIKTSQDSSASALDSLVILQRSQEGTLTRIKESSDGMTASITSIREATTTQTEVLKSVKKSSNAIEEFTHHIPEVLDVISGMSGNQDIIREQVLKLKDILDAEVAQIELSMDKTNELLERKFDEFTELLKKSNTEALVDVMRKVTEEFQKQMNALINKLIQENFDQLNKSVERLNTWQQENKEMIATLTRQYKDMADNFEATSTSLDRVKDDTQSLVSDGGKLRQIVDSLNKIIVQDEKFIKTAEHLHKTAELSQTNMESFDESTHSLNEWVRKQRNFVDGVQVLLMKLEDIAKIKDYNEQFWKGTRKQMEDGVNIISKGSQTLNDQLTSLDQSFYRRLSATLGELDNCITKMVEQVGKRR